MFLCGHVPFKATLHLPPESRIKTRSELNAAKLGRITVAYLGFVRGGCSVHARFVITYVHALIVDGCGLNHGLD